MPRQTVMHMLVGLILPILLTVLPVWVLSREAERETSRAVEQEDSAWFSGTEQHAQFLLESSHPRYWVEDALKQVRLDIERSLVASETATSLRAASYASQGVKFWGCTFPQSDVQARAQFLALPGFVTTGRTLMTQTLQEIARAQGTSGERLDAEPMSSRLRAQFGLSISGLYFQPARRGQGFAAFMEEQTGYAAWDLISSGTRTTGIIVAFLPTMNQGMRSGPRRILASWQNSELFPVFFALPTGSPHDRILVPHGFQDKPQARRLLARIQRTMHVTPGPLPNGDMLGQVKLPLALLDRPLRYGTWRFRLVSLNPACGHLGMLCQRLIPPSPGILATARDIVTRGAGVIWVIMLLFIFRTGRLPSPGVHLNLILWFMGVIAVPLLLGFSSANTLLIDREKTLTDTVTRDLEATLSAIDRESVRLHDQQAQVCRKLLDIPDQTAALKKCHLENLPPKAIFDRIHAAAIAHDLDLRSILLFGFKGYSETHIYSGWSRQTDRLFIDMLEKIYGRVIDSESPPIPLSKFPDPGKLARVGSMFSTDMSAGLKTGSVFDRVEQTTLGGLEVCTFQTRLRLDGQTWFIALLSWTQQLAFPRYLSSRLARESTRSGAPRLVAWRFDPLPGRSVVIPENAPDDLVQFAAQAKRRRVLAQAVRHGERFVYIGFPSTRMPGFVFAASISLAHIDREIAHERQTVIILFGTGILLVLLIALLLSRHLAAPIVRMSHGLSRIAAGDLNVMVSEFRQDELGQAGVSLDAMTRALRVRRQLSRFVPQQVMEIAAAGNPDLSVSGRKQHVTILSSDIRDFTTLSERHPPEKIFHMLNRHLEVMTQAIQREGGIIDRFIGDAIVAIFPTLSAQMPQYAAPAVRAARAMMLAHSALITERLDRSEFAYAMGIGIEAGEVITGVLGDPEVQLDFSVLGEPVARAADLEALSKQGTAARIVASAQIRKAAGFDCRWVPLQGHADIWELDIPGYRFPNIDIASAKAIHDDHAPMLLPREMTVVPEESHIGSANGQQIVDQDSRGVHPEVPTAHGMSRSRLLPALIGCLIWFLPYAITEHHWRALSRSTSDSLTTATLLRLQDHARFVEQSLEPSRMASLDLRHRMQVAAQKTYRLVRRETTHLNRPESKLHLFRSILPREIGRVLEPMQHTFPSLFWLHDSSFPPPETGKARFDSMSVASSGLTFSRIGDPEPASCRSISGGKVIELQAAGENIWWKDDIAFAWMPLQGDGTFTVRLADMLQTNDFAKAGLLLRESLASLSRQVFLFHQPAEGPRFGHRWSTLAQPSFITDLHPYRPPYWMRLSRAGFRVTGAVSKDGVTWTPLGECHFPASSTLFLGPAMCGRTSSLSEPDTPQVISRGGPVSSGISDDDCRLAWIGWRWTLFWRLLGTIENPQAFSHWIKTRHFFPDIQDLDSTIGGLARQLFPTTLDGRLRQLYIHPFFHTDFTCKTKNLQQTVSEGIRQRHSFNDLQTIQEFRKNLLGMLMVSIAPEELTLSSTLPLLIQEMRRRGVDLTVSDNPGPPQPFTMLPVSGNHVRLAGTAFSGSKPLLITLSRSMSDQKQQTVSVIGNESVSTIVTLVWWLFGLHLGYQWLACGVLPSIPLRKQLLIGFMAAALPFLLSSWMISERAAIEAQTRSSIDERERLLADLGRADGTRKVQDGRLSAITGHLLTRSDFIQALVNPEEIASRTLHIGTSQQTTRENILQKLFLDFVRLGFRPGGLNLVGERSLDRFPPPQDYGQSPGSTQTRMNAVGKFFNYLYRNTSGKMASIKSQSRHDTQFAGSAEETMIGAEFEGFSQGLAMILGLDRMADLTLAPSALGSWSLSADRKECMLRQLIWNNTCPLADLQFGWASNHTEPRQLDSLFIQYPDLLPDATFITPCQKIGLPWVGVPPLARLAPGTRDGYPQTLYSWKSSALFELSAMASVLKEPVVNESGRSYQTLLHAAIPGQEFPDWVFVGERRLGDTWKALANELFQRRMVLLFIVLVALGLALSVATRYLEPTSQLVQAANQIRGGEYATRLSFDRTDEFGTLATAFNQMAQAAQEGRFLGRFVPATARALAADDKRSKIARSGEARQVIILFAGLSDFKKCLTACDPGPLIVWLNQYLETMSRVIRIHGGETNKFIGDKVLAVFTPDPGKPITSIVPQALAAAQSMKQRFTEVCAAKAVPANAPELHLGIGLVAGTVLAGILGTESVRLEFTVIGDTVNLASRLCDMATRQPMGAILVEREIVLSADSMTPPAYFDHLSTTAVKGKTRAIDIYRLRESL